MQIHLPNNWSPREYQHGLWNYLHNGGKRAIAIWPRRHGKDDVGLHFTACAAHERIGNYWHLLPQQNQARKAIWDAVNPRTGKKRIDEAFPHEIRSHTRGTDMYIEFKCGSSWQVLGSDNHDALVGTPPVGVVFSEWALSDPQAWSLLRPILADNGGWALFITTPRGRNHAFNMYQMAQDDEFWFAERLTADTTGVFDEGTLDREWRELIAERGEVDGTAIYEQEYLCSWSAALPGAYYAQLIDQLEKVGRIGKVEWDPGKVVHTGWDLGASDQTVIWFVQRFNTGWAVIDYIADTNRGMDSYVRELQQKPYNYGEHLLPHDAAHQQKALPGAASIADSLVSMGLRNVRVVPRTPNVANDINQVRKVLATCWFDAEKCDHGISALRSYRREWDEKLKVYKDRPLHDWASDPADAFRTFAVGIPQDIEPYEDEYDDHYEDDSRSAVSGY